MLWSRYVFRSGQGVQALWDDLYRSRPSRLLFIAGCGFDVRVTAALERFVASARSGQYRIQSATLLLIEFGGYALADELRTQTDQNCSRLRTLFEGLGNVERVQIDLVGDGEERRATHALRDAADSIVRFLGDKTDVILDVSSLPRVVYLSVLTRLLVSLIPDKDDAQALAAGGVNFQAVVAEDAWLDSQIKSEDPSEDLVTIPGFGSAINLTSMSGWPVVWFPILGEGRVSQFEKVRTLAAIPADAEICPVIPHPSRDPRRGDRLLVEYRRQLFDANRELPESNIVYAHESNPFETYRQLRTVIDRYKKTLEALGGCRVLVTPLSSKLMTVGAGLACFEMRANPSEENFALGIPYASPTRYSVSPSSLRADRAVLSSLLLTGGAYSVEAG